LNVFTILNALGRKLNVRGSVYLNGKPIESEEYDDVFIVVEENDWASKFSEELKDKMILFIEYKDLKVAQLKQELGYD
jgi:hypothetical protein